MNGTVLHCIMLQSIACYCIVLCFIVSCCFASNNITLYYITLCCIVLYSVYYIVLCYIVLYWDALNCTVLYCMMTYAMLKSSNSVQLLVRLENVVIVRSCSRLLIGCVISLMALHKSVTDECCRLMEDAKPRHQLQLGTMHFKSFLKALDKYLCI